MKTLLCVFCVTASVQFCYVQQTKNLTDTLPKQDSSLIEDLKSNSLDNIPVISLDDNDLNDASTQNKFYR